MKLPGRFLVRSEQLLNLGVARLRFLPTDPEDDGCETSESQYRGDDRRAKDTRLLLHCDRDAFDGWLPIRHVRFSRRLDNPLVGEGAFIGGRFPAHEDRLGRASARWSKRVRVSELGGARMIIE